MAKVIQVTLFNSIVALSLIFGLTNCRDGHQPFTPTAKDAGPTGQKVTSYESVKPILEKHCSECHNKMGQRDWMDPEIAAAGKKDGAIYARIWTHFKDQTPKRMPQPNSNEEKAMTMQERQELVAWLKSSDQKEAPVATPDPGQNPDGPIGMPVPKDPVKEISMYKKMETSCFGCHGRYGVGGIDVAPHIGGLRKDYIVKQLRAFRSFEAGKVASGRHSPFMNGAAMDLKDDEIDFFADYYANLDIESIVTEFYKDRAFTEEEQALIKRGEKYAKIGMCVSCHVGSRARATAPETPSLAGQKVEVIVRELKNFVPESELKAPYRHSPLMLSLLSVPLAAQQKYEQANPDEQAEMDKKDLFRFTEEHLRAVGYYFSALIPGTPMSEQPNIPEDEDPEALFPIPAGAQ